MYCVDFDISVTSMACSNVLDGFLMKKFILATYISQGKDSIQCNIRRAMYFSSRKCWEGVKLNLFLFISLSKNAVN